jgi:hypothetical protein
MLSQRGVGDLCARRCAWRCIRQQAHAPPRPAFAQSPLLPGGALQVTLVCTEAARPHIRAWAASEGLSDDNIIAVAASRGAALDLAAALSHLRLTNPTSGATATHVLVIDAATAPEPGYSVAKVVEAGIVRGGAAMVTHVLAFDAYEAAAAQLEVRVEGGRRGAPLQRRGQAPGRGGALAPLGGTEEALAHPPLG